MLFEELQDRTNHHCTYEQYKVIEHMYNFNESMTKDEAAAIWKKTYGKEIKRREKARLNFEERLISTREEDMCNRSEDIRRAIFHAETTLRKMIGQYKGKSFIDENGTHWGVRQWGTTPNRCYTIWTLGIIHKGEFEHVRYNFY